VDIVEPKDVRALVQRHFDPVAEVAPLVLLPWRRLPFPVPWDAVFEASRPLHLEVGFGDGRFTVRRALAAPSEHFVGLEISSTSVQRARAKMAKEGV
jgi:tRNA (guanine-N7-)-methyltransferase